MVTTTGKLAKEAAKWDAVPEEVRPEAMLAVAQEEAAAGQQEMVG